MTEKWHGCEIVKSAVTPPIPPAPPIPERGGQDEHRHVVVAPSRNKFWSWCLQRFC